MDFAGLKQLLADNHLPAYHLGAVTTGLTKGLTSFSQLTSWPKTLRDQAGQLDFYSYVNSTLIPGLNHSAKAMLTYKDGVSVETVLIQTKTDHYSICVSCQSGCAMGCAFCATGKLGLTRSLTAAEITDQFVFWKQTYPDKPIKSLVFMGMGEPFANQTQVFTAIDWLHQYYGLGYRHMTVSTCGLPAGIVALGQHFPQVNLAISLHAANQNLRATLMPIAHQVSLDELAKTINQYQSLTSRQVTFEYLLLHQVTDTPSALDHLISWLAKFPKPLVHVNLIKYNVTTDKFTPPYRNRVYFALNYLREHQVSATIRKSLGDDIAGACGQLSLKRATINPNQEQ